MTLTLTLTLTLNLTLTLTPTPTPTLTLTLTRTQAVADLPLAVADAAASKTLLGCVTSVVALFYDLCAQDLPEFFEDHLQPWMEGFVVLLKYQNGAPRTRRTEPESYHP